MEGRPIRNIKCIFAIVIGLIALTIPQVSYVEAANQIIADGRKVDFNEPLLLENNRVYIPVRFVAEQLQADVKWDSENEIVQIKTSIGDDMQFKINSKKMNLNGHEYFMDVAPIIRHERTYLPVRHVAEIMHANVKWDPENMDVLMTSIPIYTIQKGDTLQSISEKYKTTVDLLKERNGLKENDLVAGSDLKVVVPGMMSYVTETEVELLARLIDAESMGEPFAGKVAVGNVILNRVEDPEFPNTITDVIYQENQFTPVKTGKINDIEPSELALSAAETALSGDEPARDALFFFNPSLTNDPFMHSRPVIARIGNHSFTR